MLIIISQSVIRFNLKTIIHVNLCDFVKVNRVLCGLLFVLPQRNTKDITKYHQVFLSAFNVDTFSLRL